MNHALRRLSLACLLMFAVLLVNANYLQGFDTSALANKPNNGRTFLAQFDYQRGPIVTADGVKIAESKPIPGIYHYQREYPKGAEYAPVTGFASLYSRTGIEQAEDKQLSGNTTQLSVRNLIAEITGKPKQGATVQLTLNSQVQQAAYQALQANGNPSGAVAIDPATGAILALASYPSFNPNRLTVLDGTVLNQNYDRLNKSPAQPLVNRAIGDTFHPGSSFKVVTASAAFASGRYSPASTISAPQPLPLPQTSNVLNNDGDTPCGNGTPQLIFAFALSCNTAYGNLGMKLGDAALVRQADKFGFNNTHLQIPLPVTESVIPSLTDLDFTAYSAIGQYDDQVTPLQEAMLAATIANGGRLMKPYLVQKVTAPDLSTLSVAQPSLLSQAVSPGVAQQMTSMMSAVVTQPYGTAYNVVRTDAPGLSIAGKTGTAENGINNSNVDDAVFTCFAPVTNPKIAVGVIVKGGGFGAAAAAPVALAIVKAYQKYLGSQW